MTIKLYFLNSNDERKSIADVPTEDDAWQKISEFLKDHDFKSYYYRTWVQNGEKWYDVGSHTEFFILVLEDESCEK